MAALEWYERSVVLQEELGDKAGLATSYNNIASVHYARGEHGAAMEWYERSVALQEELGDKAGLAVSYNNIGLIYDARGEYDTAREYLTRSLAILQQIGSPDVERAAMRLAQLEQKELGSSERVE